ncbi:hypothetical protein [Paractinoplanes durhamensis]|nr:hypothetical protein [Actinoplanes durhamensis]
MIPYRELDAEARNYVDPERVIALAKRRRSAAAAVAVVPVVLAGLVGAVVVLGPGAAHTPSVPAGEGARPSAATEAGALRPPGRSTALPAGPVGRAAYAYTPCRDACDGVFVVLTDGRQFVLPAPADGGPPVHSITMSRDGRWLGYQSHGRYMVRSLTDVRVHAVKSAATDAVFPVAWSSDSGRLLLQRTDSDTNAAYTVLEVGSGLATQLTAPAGTKAFGILPDGTVLFRNENSTGPVVAWSTSAGQTVTIDVTAQLDGESVRSVNLAPDNQSVYVVAARSVEGQDSRELTAVIHADFTGKVLGRYEIPKMDLENQFCDVLGPTADGFALSCRNGSGSMTTLLAVSAAGPQPGIKISAQDWPNHPELAEIVIPG